MTLETKDDLEKITIALNNAVLDPPIHSPPPAAFGAGGPRYCLFLYIKQPFAQARSRLKQFDQSSASSRGGYSTPKSVVGIGGKGALVLLSLPPLILIPSSVAKPDYSEAKIVIAMVGLPARGKSYLSNKLMRYLKVCIVLHPRGPSHSPPQWLEYDVKVFESCLVGCAEA